jgi:DNA-binding response OmpR family regulator
VKKVLIVEHDKLTAEILRDSVSVLNFQSFNLQDGESLAIALIDLDPEIIIISRQLFIKHKQLFISSTNPNERLSEALIVITSNALLDPDRVRELGAHFFLFKPFDLSTLQQVLESASGSISLCE